MAATIFETDRLRFRPYTPADEESAFEMFADPYARAFYPRMADRANVRAWIEWNLRNYEEHGFGLWALELRESGAFIGDCGLTFQEVEDHEELEIGYHVVQPERGQGYATEAAAATLDYGFRSTTSNTICSIVSPENIASRAVATRVHTASRTFTKNGETLLLYFTTRSNWPGRNG